LRDHQPGAKRGWRLFCGFRRAPLPPKIPLPEPGGATGWKFTSRQKNSKILILPCVSVAPCPAPGLHGTGIPRPFFFFSLSDVTAQGQSKLALEEMILEGRNGAAHPSDKAAGYKAAGLQGARPPAALFMKLGGSGRFSRGAVCAPLAWQRGCRRDESARPSRASRPVYKETEINVPKLLSASKPLLKWETLHAPCLIEAKSWNPRCQALLQGHRLWLGLFRVVLVNPSTAARFSCVPVPGRPPGRGRSCSV